MTTEDNGARKGGMPGVAPGGAGHALMPPEPGEVYGRLSRPTGSGWTLVEVFEDTASAKTLAKRPGLEKALSMVEGDEAQALVVAKMDRLSRSLKDFADLMERSRKKGWALVALDLGVDTTTPSGEMLANILAVFAQFERRLIGQRTKDALAVKRSQGVRLGRPTALPKDVVDRIHGLRRKKKSLREIAEVLDSEGVSTAHGGRQWYPSTVRAVLTSTSRRR